MANRVLLTASVSPAPGRQAKVRHYGALGHPRRPDIVKRNGRFNAEDIDTVVRLQSALATIEPYAFYYVDDHDELIPRLEYERPRLVFNLCDEGFHNRPDMELHIPALLEMRGTAYTGAPRSCLAVCHDKSVVRGLALALNVPVRPKSGSCATTPSRLRSTIRSLSNLRGRTEVSESQLVCRRQQAIALGRGRSAQAPAWRQRHRRSGVSERTRIYRRYHRQCRERPDRAADHRGRLLRTSIRPPHSMPRLEMGRVFLGVDWHPLLQGGDRGGRGAAHGECSRRPVRCARLPRLCSFRFSRRHGWRDQAARSQSELQLVLDGKMAIMAGVAGMSYPGMLQAILDCAWRRTQ